MIDNQLRQDTRINVNMIREIKEEIIREVEEKSTFLVPSLNTQQVQNMTPQYHQQDAVIQQYQHQPYQMEQQAQQQRV